METVDEFRSRVREWLRANMPALPPSGYPSNPMASEPEDRFSRSRELQRRLWDGGLAGVTFPVDCGGLGRPFEYLAALVAESEPYEMPLRFTMPTFGIIGATIVDYGTPEQRSRFIPPMLRGDALWVQLLSEPSCGSDLAGVRMRAERDGDVFVLNGEKVWSSAAYGCDWGMCLARTDWSVGKHAGVTMFAIDLSAPGVSIHPIRQVDGTEEFCSVVLDDVIVHADQVIGDVDGGWKVATTLMGHERDSVGGSSPYMGNVKIHTGAGQSRVVLRSSPTTQVPDAVGRDLVAAHHIDQTVRNWLITRVGLGVERGHYQGPAGALLRLYKGVHAVLEASLAIDLGGMSAVVWGDDPAAEELGLRYLRRQANCLAGGSNEMQRNLISERMLGMPREAAPDRDRPYSEVPSSGGGTPRGSA